MGHFQQTRAILGKCDVVVTTVPGGLKVGKSCLPLPQIWLVHVPHSRQIIITLGAPVITDLVLKGTPKDCEHLYSTLYKVCHADAVKSATKT